MKLLFSMRHFGYVRYYESALAQLAAGGHDVVVAAEQRELGPGFDLAQLTARVPAVRWIETPEPDPTPWPVLARCVRSWLDFLRFSDAVYEQAPKYRQRVEDRMPRSLRALARLSAGLGIWATRGVAGALRAIERALPGNPAIDQFLDDQQPDLVLLTPLLYLGSWQGDILKSAKAQGRKTALCIASWDHLSSKSFIRELPDRVFVWNDTQRHEALTLHRVPADRIVVTGAQCFDHWFGRPPSRTRTEFFDRVGLPGDRPMLLYVCSALLVNSPPEPELVKAWIQHVRESRQPALREAAILVRPHPARVNEWAAVDWSFENVAVWGSNPVDAAGKDDYFDSLYYSTAVVGVNTSAFLEAAIIGRPVLTVIVPEFRDNQEGTLHFKYLTEASGGVLRVARDFTEHIAQLEEENAVNAPPSARHQAFVAAFVRPRGLDRSANDVFVSEVERLLADAAPTPSERQARRSLWVPLLRPLAAVARFAFEDELQRIDRGVRKERDRRDREARLESRRRYKQELAQKSAAEREALVQQRQAARRARLAEQQRGRLADARAAETRRRDKERRKRERYADKRRRERQTRRGALVQKLKRLLLRDQAQ